jgi:hypothetical protein
MAWMGQRREQVPQPLQSSRSEAAIQFDVTTVFG